MPGAGADSARGRSGRSGQFATDDNFEALRIAPYLRATAMRHPGLCDLLMDLAQRTASTRLAVVHGDVSPKNVLLGPRGPVLLDAARDLAHSHAAFVTWETPQRLEQRAASLLPALALARIDGVPTLPAGTIYARLLAAEPHATAERQRQDRERVTWREPLP